MLTDSTPTFQPRASKETLIAKHFVETQAVVVGTGVGEGFIAYLGDVNPSPQTAGVIIALCGLPEPTGIIDLD